MRRVVILFPYMLSAKPCISQVQIILLYSLSVFSMQGLNSVGEGQTTMRCTLVDFDHIKTKILVSSGNVYGLGNRLFKELFFGG